MQNRIKELRKYLNLTQAAFGEKIAVKPNTITNYETGLRVPSDSVVRSICREFGVSEMWLRTGEGEMFPPRDNMEDLLYLSGRFFSSEPTEFQQRFARMMYSLTPEEWALLEKKARFLLGQEE